MLDLDGVNKCFLGLLIGDILKHAGLKISGKLENKPRLYAYFAVRRLQCLLLMYSFGRLHCLSSTLYF